MGSPRHLYTNFVLQSTPFFNCFIWIRSDSMNFNGFPLVPHRNFSNAFQFLLNFHSVESIALHLRPELFCWSACSAFYLIAFLVRFLVRFFRPPFCASISDAFAAKFGPLQVAQLATCSVYIQCITLYALFYIVTMSLYTLLLVTNQCLVSDGYYAQVWFSRK